MHLSLCILVVDLIRSFMLNNLSPQLVRKLIHRSHKIIDL